MTVNQDLGKRIDGVDAQISQLQKLFSGLAGKVDQLEKQAGA